MTPLNTTRKRGRPRKTETLQVTPEAPRRGRGRPRKSENSKVMSADTPRRGRGRPRKTNVSTVLSTDTPRRGRGRPRKAEMKSAPLYQTGAPGSYENRQDHIPAMDMPSIESWVFQYPESQTDLKVEIPEFTCICPKTGLPDFATIIIEYRPQKLCLELKSLKEYILFFRNVGIFHEHVVNRILKDCARSCKPESMKVTGIFNSRGGILTTAVATL